MRVCPIKESIELIYSVYKFDLLEPRILPEDCFRFHINYVPIYSGDLLKRIFTLYCLSACMSENS